MNWANAKTNVEEWKGIGPHPEILLHPQIPKPLHCLAPREIFGPAWWEVTRQAAYLVHRNRCWACGVPKEQARYHRWLEAHERYSIDYTAKRSTFLGVCALCHACHQYVHVGRLQSLVDAGVLSVEFFCQVIDHGEAVLRRAGFIKFRPEYPPEATNPDWKAWRLVIDGKEYGPRFKSALEHETYFAIQNAKAKR